MKTPEKLSRVLVALSLGAACAGSVEEGRVGGSELDPGARAGAPGANGGRGGGSSVVAPEFVAPPSACSGALPALPRRLSRHEYNNTVAMLFGDTSKPADRWTVEAQDSGFDNDSSSLNMSAARLTEFRESAESVADYVVKNLDAILPRKDAAGVDTFLPALLRKAYRRPPSSEELAAIRKVYQAAGATSLAEGIRAVVETILQAPAFLYRFEVGTPARGGLAQHDLAARLSFFLWESPPDDELSAKADRGALGSQAEIRAEVDRMLRDKRGVSVMQRFVSQWLETGGVATTTRDPKSHPTFGPDLAAAMVRGTEAFVAHVMFQSPEGTFKELLSAPYTFVTSATAPLYGLPDPKSTVPVKRDLDANLRAGLITDVTVLAAHSKFDGSGPVGRGAFLMERVVCEPMPSPPPDVPELGELAPGLTTRDLLEMHRRDPSCAACHNRIDPFGVPLESYDAVGAHRTKEGDLPIRTDSVISGMGDLDGPVANGVALAQRLAGSAKTHACFVKQMFRFATGRPEVEADSCVLGELQRRTGAAGSKIRDLVLAIVESPAFLAPPSTSPSACQ